MKTLYQSLAAFQQEVPVIHKETQGYGYSYADLPTIFEKINPLLKKHGLGFTQLLNGESLKTIVFHIESGETLESEVSIPQDVELKGMNKFQVIGSAVTYYRRYSLSAALGLVTDLDNDAQGEQQDKADNRPWFNKEHLEKIKAEITSTNAKEIMGNIKQEYKISREMQNNLKELYESLT